MIRCRPKRFKQLIVENITHTITFLSFLIQLNAARMLEAEFGGEIPSDIDSLMRLPGVGRKTANVMLSVVWNKAAMAVDTHVFRVSNRMGLTDNAKTPLQTETTLMKYIPTPLVAKAHHWLILHGRYTCTARRPSCMDCMVKQWCRSYTTLKPSSATAPVFCSLEARKEAH